MDYLIPLLERVERVERCKRPWMWGMSKDREYARCFSTRDRGLGGYQNIRGFSRSCCPSTQDLDDERESLDDIEPKAMTDFHARGPNEVFLVPIQTAT